MTCSNAKISPAFSKELDQMTSTGSLKVQSFYIHVTTSLQLRGMNPSSGDNESQVCPNTVLRPYPQPAAAMVFAFLVVVVV